MDELLNPTEAAARLGVSRSFVYDLMSRGVLRFYQLGGTRRIAAADLADYLAAQRRGGQGPGQPHGDGAGRREAQAAR